MSLATMRLFRPIALLAALAFAVPLSAAAADLPQPSGKVMLTISGKIEHTNVDGTAQFDLDMLKAMHPITVKTSTIWTDGTQTFTGVRLHDLMEAVGADADTLDATAINDYAVQIPSDDWGEDGAIVAYEQNGKPMSVRDKGPLWVIYPFDQDKKFQTEVTYSRSIWQLDRIIVGK
ncbi:molybdopterin-dependent oxidoreductase [Pseudooceanicola sp. CBS1P-1]|uniref:Molybdopterin-dependent oxidoreductase n=1 Tax=Pseudooceanicola albus TaxID=2692189 RepID=A0A6L7G6T1_9RHOB|nr:MULTISPECIES: molybdopterin-dependent oxidoreductase [Pseudooceanicola]MBT9383040.1 molybdopterin-dependent oxidoreductase [Pseudooceanicola endophyticus]MXN19228.1 molybdopterin-dependent oxidoreductase [Pseudooceanicola albus]